MTDNAPETPTDEEMQAQQAAYNREQSKGVWCQFAMIAMQCYKLQSDILSRPEEIAKKSATLADRMLCEFQDRFH